MLSPWMRRTRSDSSISAVAKPALRTRTMKLKSVPVSMSVRNRTCSNTSRRTAPRWGRRRRGRRGPGRGGASSGARTPSANTVSCRHSTKSTSGWARGTRPVRSPCSASTCRRRRRTRSTVAGGRVDARVAGRAEALVGGSGAPAHPRSPRRSRRSRRSSRRRRRSPRSRGGPVPAGSRGTRPGYAAPFHTGRPRRDQRRVHGSLRQEVAWGQPASVTSCTGSRRIRSARSVNRSSGERRVLGSALTRAPRSRRLRRRGVGASTSISSATSECTKSSTSRCASVFDQP